MLDGASAQQEGGAEGDAGAATGDQPGGDSYADTATPAASAMLDNSYAEAEQDGVPVVGIRILQLT